jgi:hypothetical protein
MTPATITAESTHVVRDRHFSPDAGDESILAALAHLRREHVTGQLIVDISCGGVATLRFREQQQVNFPEK